MDREVAACCKRFHSSSLTNEVALPRITSLLPETLLLYLVISWNRGHRLEVKRFDGGMQEPQQVLGVFVYFPLKSLCLQRLPRAGLQIPVAMAIKELRSLQTKEGRRAKIRQAEGRGVFP